MSRLGLGVFAPLALVALILFAYAPTLDAEFVVWDDDDHIYENASVIGAEGYWHAWKDWRNRLFYPATYTAFWIEWRLADGQPWLFHLNNVLIHVVDALLLALLGRVLGLGHAVAWTAAGLWALNPLEVQTVAWATERKNVLYVLFYLLALLAHARSVEAREEGRARFWLAALGCVLLSLLAKPAGVTAPAALLLLHWAVGARFDRRAWLRLLSYFAVALPMAAIHIAREEITPGAPFGIRILIAARATWTYVGRFLWPVDLVPMYPRWPVEENPLPSVIALAGLVAVAAFVAWRIRRIPRPATFALGLYVINIGPVVGIIWFPYLWYSLTADHLAYLPSAGLAILLAMALAAGAARLRVSSNARIAGVALVWLVLAVATRAQTGLWHDTETLWTRTLAVMPESIAAHKNLGFALLGEGRVGEARSHFEEVLRLRPDDPEALLNLGLVAAGEGDLDRAVELYGQTLAQSPDNAQAYTNLGIVAAQRGDLDGAVAAYRRAIEIDPQDPAPRTNLGAALVDRDEIDAGIREHEAALRLDPRFVNAHYNLGIAHLRAGRPDQAAEHFRIANELAPGDVDTLYILGVALGQLGRHEEAAGHYRRLLTIDPEHADATNNLAASLLALGDAAQALPLFERALALAPEDPASYRILARVLARNGQRERAIAVLEKGIAALPAPQPELEAQLAELRGRGAS